MIHAYRLPVQIICHVSQANYRKQFPKFLTTLWNKHSTIRACFIHQNYTVWGEVILLSVHRNNSVQKVRNTLLRLGGKSHDYIRREIMVSNQKFTSRIDLLYVSNRPINIVYVFILNLVGRPYEYQLSFTVLFLWTQTKKNTGNFISNDYSGVWPQPAS